LVEGGGVFSRGNGGVRLPFGAVMTKKKKWWFDWSNKIPWGGRAGRFKNVHRRPGVPEAIRGGNLKVKKEKKRTSRPMTRTAKIWNTGPTEPG